MSIPPNAYGLINTLENTAQFLNQHALSWMIIGGAAMVLYGLEDGPVADIDIVLSSSSAAFLSKQFSWPNFANTQSPRFRSEYLLRPNFGPVPVEILGGFRVSTMHEWVEVPVGETQMFFIRSQTLFLPTRKKLASIFLLCGREKDRRRMALLNGN
ncbi:hypothetical protein [Klebsiella electrica]|uniref:Uncharacterized protein n=1 Tax=Klebsiella electrica TaxID=1259973 RepID=A0AAJ5UC49_9ENTR|nr:hypothetical protein [Klebsiella electrica]WBW59226.1 hypothetical protein OR613_14330 [Klebsiella electrica]